MDLRQNYVDHLRNIEEQRLKMQVAAGLSLVCLPDPAQSAAKVEVAKSPQVLQARPSRVPSPAEDIKDQVVKEQPTKEGEKERVARTKSQKRRYRRKMNGTVIC